MSELNRDVSQVRAVALSSLSGDAVKCWLRIFYLEDGRLDVLRVAIDDLAAPVDELVEAGWCRTARAYIVAVDPISTVGKLSEVDGEERTVKALSTPSLKGAAPVILEATDEVLREYNVCRKAAGIKQVKRSPSHNKFLRKLARFLIAEKVSLADYATYAIPKTRFMKSPYPTLKTLSGEWMQSLYLSRDTAAEERTEAKTGHAGKTYASAAEGTATRLEEAGCGKWGPPMCRHIETQAEVERKQPHARTLAKNEKLEAAIIWLAAHGE